MFGRMASLQCRISLSALTTMDLDHSLAFPGLGLIRSFVLSFAVIVLEVNGPKRKCMKNLNCMTTTHHYPTMNI